MPVDETRRLEAGGAGRCTGLVEQRGDDALDGDRDPRRHADAVLGHGQLRHLDAESGEAVGGVPHHLVDVGFRVRMAEAFSQDADPQAGRRCSASAST